jgi:hypothetical protein
MNNRSSAGQIRNPDITFPPNNSGRQAIVTSNPGAGWNGSPLINNWVEAPSESGTFVLGAIGGVIQWIETESCD